LIGPTAGSRRFVTALRPRPWISLGFLRSLGGRKGMGLALLLSAGWLRALESLPATFFVVVEATGALPVPSAFTFARTNAAQTMERRGLRETSDRNAADCLVRVLVFPNGGWRMLISLAGPGHAVPDSCAPLPMVDGGQPYASDEADAGPQTFIEWVAWYYGPCEEGFGPYGYPLFRDPFPAFRSGRRLAGPERLRPAPIRAHHPDYRGDYVRSLPHYAVAAGPPTPVRSGQAPRSDSAAPRTSASGSSARPLARSPSPAPPASEARSQQAPPSAKAAGA